jgi:hypothetical protein
MDFTPVYFQEVSASGSSKPMLEATVAAIHSIIQSDLGSGLSTFLYSSQLSRIRDVYLGSEFSPSRIQDQKNSGSRIRIKEF